MKRLFPVFVLISLLAGKDVLAKAGDNRVTTYGGKGFSIHYPDDVFDVEETSGAFLKLKKRSLNPRENLNEVLISIESAHVPSGKKCKATLFKSLINGYAVDTLKTVTEGEVTYSISSAQNPSKNHRQTEEIWAIVDSNPCVAIRYLYDVSNNSAFAGFEKKEYDREELNHLFSEVRHAVIFPRVEKISTVDVSESKAGALKTYNYKQGKNSFLISYPQEFSAEKNGLIDPNYFDNFGRGNGVVIYRGDFSSLVNPTFAVEMLPIFPSEKCRAKMFVNSDRMAIKEREFEENNLVYSMIDSLDRYDDRGPQGREIIFALRAKNSCIGIRYFYATISDGANSSSDRSSVLTAFDKIRHSLVIN